MAGYHLTEIKKGTLGQLSKVQEELDEAVDSVNQGVKIMLLVELSDLVGAVKAVFEKNAVVAPWLSDTSIIDKVTKSSSLTEMQKCLDKSIQAESIGDKEQLINSLNELIVATSGVAKIQGSTFHDLLKMQQVTERAFKSGSRK